MIDQINNKQIFTVLLQDLLQSCKKNIETIEALMEFIKICNDDDLATHIECPANYPVVEDEQLNEDETISEIDMLWEKRRQIHRQNQPRENNIIIDDNYFHVVDLIPDSETIPLDQPIDQPIELQEPILTDTFKPTENTSDTNITTATPPILITPLNKLNKKELAALENDIFMNACKNVKQLFNIAPNSLEYEYAVCKEADRLLESWLRMNNQK